MQSIDFPLQEYLSVSSQALFLEELKKAIQTMRLEIYSIS